MEIYHSLFPDNVPEGWEDTFIDCKEGIKTTCKIIQKTIKKTKCRIVPEVCDIFNAWRMIRPEDVKVVIVGQDVYPARGRACGLAFSTISEDVPRSLVNIYKEIKANYPNFVIPNHGDLSPWCRQGVMLLNMSLTTVEGESNKHKGIWMSMIESTVRTLTNLNRKIIWVMWGGAAQKLSSVISKRGIELICGHPSPLGAGAREPFSGCKHFVMINKALNKMDKSPIYWGLPLNLGDEVSDETLESSEHSITCWV